MQSNHFPADAVSLRAISDIEETVSELKEISTEKSLFDAQAQLTLRHIADIYSESNPASTGEDYLKNFFIPIVKSELDPYAVLQGKQLELPHTNGQPDVYRLLIAALLLSNQAANLYKSKGGCVEMAWRVLSEASFWCGCASVGDKMFDLSKMADIAAKREAQAVRQNGVKKAKDKRVAEVARLLRDLVPSNRWNSYTHAAQVIQHHLIQKQNPDVFLNLSEADSGVRTITGYIESAIKLDPEIKQLIVKNKKPGPPKIRR